MNEIDINGTRVTVKYIHSLYGLQLNRKKLLALRGDKTCLISINLCYTSLEMLEAVRTAAGIFNKIIICFSAGYDFTEREKLEKQMGCCIMETNKTAAFHFMPAFDIALKLAVEHAPGGNAVVMVGVRELDLYAYLQDLKQRHALLQMA
ncbi:MAG TPA: hypothetical protein VD905_16255 [Flavobacteriales bacterium]|nr:hypothetical protein [Flavobacteriales bacterium]